MTVNNQDKIAKEINSFMGREGYSGVEAVGDDGSVGVRVVGSESYTKKVAEVIEKKFGDIQVGDGVQMGEIFINNDALNIHGEPFDVMRGFLN